MTRFLGLSKRHPAKIELFKRLTLVASIIFMTCSAQAAAPDPLSKSMTFYGRWDLRAPDRAITVNTGSYIYVHFNGSSLQARFDLGSYALGHPTLAWKVDQTDWQQAELWSVMQLGNNLAPGPHTACLMVRGLDEHDSRWTPPLLAQITFLGFVLPADGAFLPPLDEWIHPKLKMEFLGDSITEGVLVGDPNPHPETWSWLTDSLRSWAWLTRQNLGAEGRQVGFGATGVDHGGSGGAPGALDSFNFFYAGCPRDEWQPDLVVINQGSNDNGRPQEQYQPAYAKYLALIRQGYPNAKIAAVRPFGGYQEAAIKAAVSAAQNAGDKNIFYIDTTGWYSGALHPGYQDSPMLAEKMTAALKSQVLGWPTQPSAPTPASAKPQ